MLHPPDRTLLKSALFAFALLPGAALAEVSDKEPTIQLFWTVGLAAGLLCLFAARLRPWLGALVFLATAFWYLSLFLEIHSADVGPHLRFEQGTAYYVQAYVSFATVLLGLLAGIIWHRHSSPSRPTVSPR